MLEHLATAFLVDIMGDRMRSKQLAVIEATINPNAPSVGKSELPDHQTDLQRKVGEELEFMQTLNS